MSNIIKAKDLKTAITLTEKFASKELSKFVLTGIHLRNKGKGKVDAVATDSHTMRVYTFKAKVDFDSLTIHPSEFKAIKSSTRSELDPTELMQIDGSFPAYEMLLPDTSRLNKLTFDGKAMLNSLKLLKAEMKTIGKKEKRVLLVITGDEIILSDYQGFYEYRVACQWDSKNVCALLNIDYLTKSLLKEKTSIAINTDLGSTTFPVIGLTRALVVEYLNSQTIVMPQLLKDYELPEKYQLLVNEKWIAEEEQPVEDLNLDDLKPCLQLATAKKDFQPTTTKLTLNQLKSEVLAAGMTKEAVKSQYGDLRKRSTWLAAYQAIALAESDSVSCLEDGFGKDLEKTSESVGLTVLATVKQLSLNVLKDIAASYHEFLSEDEALARYFYKSAFKIMEAQTTEAIEPVLTLWSNWARSAEARKQLIQHCS